MTAPRIPLFQRKGPAPGGDRPPGAPTENAMAPDDGGAVPVQCPACGCQFDAATGEPMGDMGDAGDGGGPPLANAGPPAPPGAPS